MPRPNTKTLPQIASQIRAIEKKKFISGAIEIGKLLCEAEEKCEHGQFMQWLDDEFDYSHQTSLNYRNAFQFSIKFPSLGTLDLTLEALYLVASMDDEDQQPAVKAIIKEAKKRHVTLQIAHDIIEEMEEPPPARKPREPPPIEPLDDEDGDEDDETPIAPDDE